MANCKHDWQEVRHKKFPHRVCMRCQRAERLWADAWVTVDVWMEHNHRYRVREAEALTILDKVYASY